MAAILALGFGFFLARSIAKPIQAIAQSAMLLAEGDVNQQITITSNDEIGELANAFRQTIAYQQQIAKIATQLAQGNLVINFSAKSDKDVLGNALSQMIANLRSLIGQVQQGADQVAKASRQLNIAAEQSAEAGQQVATIIQQVAKGTNQQSNSVTTATHNVEQMARAAEGIAKGSQDQAQSIQKTSGLINNTTNTVNKVGQIADLVTNANAKVTQAARHGVTSVEQTSQGMQNIRARSIVATGKVKEMNLRAKEIGRIVETIDNIADV